MSNKNVYLIANYAAKPRNRSQTFQSGYMSLEDNVQWDESVDIVTRLKDKDLSFASIILNINAQKVVKNSFNNDKTFMELFEYFYTSSPEQISHALQRVGITVAKPEQEITDVETIPTDVQAEEEASARPELATSAEPAIAS